MTEIKWSEVPHPFTTHKTYTAGGCSQCGKPESAPIHEEYGRIQKERQARKSGDFDTIPEK